MAAEDDGLFALPTSDDALPAGPVRVGAPLAVRMRPRTLAEVVGRPTRHGGERVLYERLTKLRRAVRGEER